jgi:hypothetical protein
VVFRRAQRVCYQQDPATVNEMRVERITDEGDAHGSTNERNAFAAKLIFKP